MSWISLGNKEKSCSLLKVAKRWGCWSLPSLPASAGLEIEQRPKYVRKPKRKSWKRKKSRVAYHKYLDHENTWELVGIIILSCLQLDGENVLDITGDEGHHPVTQTVENEHDWSIFITWSDKKRNDWLVLKITFPQCLNWLFE